MVTDDYRSESVGRWQKRLTIWRAQLDEIVQPGRPGAVPSPALLREVNLLKALLAEVGRRVETLCAADRVSWARRLAHVDDAWERFRRVMETSIERAK